MRWFLNECGKYRERLCLLASGSLNTGERGPLTPARSPNGGEGEDCADAVELENHLATCAGCRKYFDEIKSMATLLANWEAVVPPLEPDQAVRARWAKDFQAAIAPNPPGQFALIIKILDWCHDMIWPCRRIWAGFAAVWAVIFAVNFSTRDNPQTMAAKSSRPSPEMVRAYLAGEGYLAQWSKPAERSAAEPPKNSSPPPRSERRPKALRA